MDVLIRYGSDRERNKDYLVVKEATSARISAAMKGWHTNCGNRRSTILAYGVSGQFDDFRYEYPRVKARMNAYRRMDRSSGRLS